MANQATQQLPPPADVDRRAYSIPEWCTRWDQSRATAYNLIAKGKLKATKVGRRTVILREHDLEFEQSLLEQQEA